MYDPDSSSHFGFLKQRYEAAYRLAKTMGAVGQIYKVLASMLMAASILFAVSDQGSNWLLFSAGAVIAVFIFATGTLLQGIAGILRATLDAAVNSRVAAESR